MKIHKEGYLTIFIVLLIVVVLAFISNQFINGYKTLKYILDAVLIIVFLLVVYFFRTPRRSINLNHEHILAPADGKVVVIEEVFESEYFKDKRIQISIFMSPLNVHCNRYPCAGVMRYFKYHQGSYLVAWHPKSSEENERTTIVIENNKHFVILVRQIAGALARRIVCNAVVGETVKQGQELGFIKFGSRLDVFLPLNAEINVKLGDITKAGKTVLAEI